MTRQLRSAKGFTLVEMLIATTIMMLVTGAVFQMLNPAQGTAQSQPEAADMQQRLRVAVDSLTKDLIMAGAGSYMGSATGALHNYFAPIMPYRIGDLDSDVKAGTIYRSDAISLMYVPTTPGQTRGRTIGNNSQELRVEPQTNCAAVDKKIPNLCGFQEGKRVLIYDPTMGAWDLTTITQVQDAALHLQHSGKLSTQYDNAMITEISAHTYYLLSNTTTQTFQLMHYDGFQTDLPVVDNVVKLEFEYFGEPLPPRLLPNACLNAECIAPATTYGPRPPALGADRPGDSWGAGENCAFKVENGLHVPRLATLATGVGQVKLDPKIFQDATPLCPDPDAATPYDADLLRIRRVRVKLRVQAALETLRGTGPLFMRPGTATSPERLVPDQEISFDVTPRNMNLGR